MMRLSATGYKYLIRNANFFFINVESLCDEYQLLFMFSSQPDETFVEEDIINYLEELGFKICWHQRDFMPGTNIAENIADSTEHSRRMIIIISR